MPRAGPAASASWLASGSSGVQVLHRELVKACNAPDVKSQVLATGSEVAADTPE